MEHDIKCHAPLGCQEPDYEYETICDKCEYNLCECAECEEKRLA